MEEIFQTGRKYTYVYDDNIKIKERVVIMRTEFVLSTIGTNDILL